MSAESVTIVNDKLLALEEICIKIEADKQQNMNKEKNEMEKIKNKCQNLEENCSKLKSLFSKLEEQNT